MTWRLRAIFVLFIAFVIVVAFVLAGILALDANRGQSCEERGGQRVFSGFMTINNMVGKVMVPTLVPQYRCEMARP